MADDRTDPLSDVFNLFAAPLAGTIRSFEQFRKGVDEFLAGVENFNRTMANLNETTERINSLLADVEEPIRAAVPQVTRTVKAADEMMQVVSGPAMAVAPGLNRLAETLSTPAFAQLPSQINQFSELLGEVSRRLGPLTQFAESAGGLLGGFRMPGLRPQGQATSAPSTPSTTSTTASGTTGSPAGTPASHDEPAKTSAADSPSPDTSSPDTSSDTEPVTAKQAASRKVTTKRKPPAKKAAAGKRATKKKAAKKKAARTKATAKKSAPSRRSTD